MEKNDGLSEPIQAAALEQIIGQQSSPISQLPSKIYNYFCLILVLQDEGKNHSLIAFSASLELQHVPLQSSSFPVRRT